MSQPKATLTVYASCCDRFEVIAEKKKMESFPKGGGERSKSARGGLEISVQVPNDLSRIDGEIESRPEIFVLPDLQRSHSSKSRIETHLHPDCSQRKS